MELFLLVLALVLFIIAGLVQWLDREGKVNVNLIAWGLAALTGWFLVTRGG